MSIEDRKNLAKYLKHGDLMIIAEKANMSVGSVSKWINGHFEKSGCQPYFEAIVEKRKAELDSTMKSL